MATAALPRTNPTDVGLSAAGVGRFLDRLEQAELELHSLMVLRHGQVAVEAWWAPYTADDVHLLYSLSKSFTATALGFAVQEGLVGLDDTVVSHFPQYAELATDPRVRAMRVRHLAAMATGHRADTLDQVQARRPADPVATFLSIPPEEEPGTIFCYHNTATYVLGAIVAAAAGTSLTSYLRPRLFDPLGIDRAYWDAFLDGRDLAFTGLHLTTESVARFGELYLRDGVWAGHQLLPVGWVAEATRVHTPNPAEPNPDWQQGYGFQFWRARHGYRGDGAFGQFCLVLPEQDAVIVTTAATEDMQAVLDAAWTELLPAFDAAASAEQDAELAARLPQLALRVPSRGTQSADGALTVVDVAEGPNGWLLTVRDHDQTGHVECGDGAWRRTSLAVGADIGAGARLEVAARGGWTSPDRFEAELVFVETPHHIAVTFDPGTATSIARWHTAPLRFPSIFTLATER